MISPKKSGDLATKKHPNEGDMGYHGDLRHWNDERPVIFQAPEFMSFHLAIHR